MPLAPHTPPSLEAEVGPCSDRGVARQPSFSGDWRASASVAKLLGREVGKEQRRAATSVSSDQICAAGTDYPVETQSAPIAMSWRVLAGLALATYLCLAAILWLEIRHGNGGHFVYALDDPYIHLALSEGLAHGHYGINAGEAAAPSSSLLWPLLLSLFSPWRYQVYVPLALNLLAGVAACVLIGAAVARWPRPLSATDCASERLNRGLSAIALVFIGNLLGLTFTGMEHTLQVLLAGAAAWGISCCLRRVRIPGWVLVATALGPAVRYESLSLVFAVALALWGCNRRRDSILLVTVSTLPLVLFSCYLHSLHLGWLPTSVLVKGGMAAPEVGLLHHCLRSMKLLITSELGEQQQLVLSILFLLLVSLAFRERERVRRFAVAGAASAVGLHLVIGRFNWFHRYEVYAVFFAALVVLHIVHEHPRGLLGWYALALLGCCYPYIQTIGEVARSAGDVYREQYQMHRFVTEFRTGNFAVNDLGLASYHRLPDTYVLDLWGLGSLEAAQQRDKSTAWLDRVTKAHHISLVMDYAHWFGPPPPRWLLLGELCLKQRPVALGDACVDYYATDPATASDLQKEFDDFITSVPGDVEVRHPTLRVPPSVL